jgi:hypothetical protein
LATNLSTYFRQRRLKLGLRLGEVVRRMGYRRIAGAANKIVTFEEEGDIRADLFEKLAAALDIDDGTIQRLIAQDHREFVERWNKWADQPIEPHLVVRVIPGVFFEEEIAEGVKTTEAMEEYAADYARRMCKKVWLILTRRLTIFFREDGTKHVQEAVPGQCNSPFMCIEGSKQKFRFTPSMGMRPLNEPEMHGPMVET